jgi:hypothetical protein
MLLVLNNAIILTHEQHEFSASKYLVMKAIMYSKRCSANS